MPKIKIIANPVAGGGNGRKAIPQIQQIASRYDLDYDLAISEGHWHAVELTRQAAEDGYEIVVAAGGDGTINEVINGLMEIKTAGKQPPALGVLTAGRGNDFAYGVNIPYGLEAGVKVIKQGHQRAIDIGRVYGGLYPQGRYFGNCVGVGFDAIGTIEVAKLPRLGGFLSYVIAVIKTIFLYFQAPVSTVIFNDQRITQPSLLISIMNGQRLGGGFKPAPTAKPDDGLFDLCIAHQVSRLEMFKLLPLFLRGTQASHPAIQTAQATHITVTCEEGRLPAQTDGEILCVDGTRLEVELLASQIKVICQPVGGES